MGNCAQLQAEATLEFHISYFMLELPILFKVAF